MSVSINYDHLFNFGRLFFYTMLVLFCFVLLLCLVVSFCFVFFVCLFNAYTCMQDCRAFNFQRQTATKQFLANCFFVAIAIVRVCFLFLFRKVQPSRITITKHCVSNLHGKCSHHNKWQML